MALTDLPGVGPALAARLESLGIEQPVGLLLHLPMRYEDRTRMVSLVDLHDREPALSCGQVMDVQIRYGRRRSLLVRVADGDGEITLRLFHFSQRQLSGFRPGQWLRLYGEPRWVGTQLEIVHPEYRALPEAEARQPAETALTPVYPSTAGLSQQRLRSLIATQLARVDKLLPDVFATELRPSLHEALRTMHAPPAGASLEQARQRLVLEELLAHRLAMLNLRAQTDRYQAPPLRGGRWRERFVAALPFTLTAAQQRVLAEIEADMAASRPMLRLVQGDVGSGKTAVAAAAAASAVEAGLRVALMAPTEILARQHYANFQRWFSALEIPVMLLVGGLSAPERQLLDGTDGPAVLIGTHALFHHQGGIGEVGLVIVDEQHRFGVNQRLALRDLASASGRHPHQLVMTATPIPRTLAQTFYADLDLSVIDELPPGRQPVSTVALPQSRREEVIERLRVVCQQGRQAYWVSPVIEASEWAQAAEEIHAELTAALPGLRIELVHGRLKARDKQAVMSAFAAGEVQVLVATTVIEVGVDVPNASVMVIDNAERLGLAQLHQLRGRVGRGSTDSYCLLMYRPPLSESARARLEALRAEHDGFRLAEKDLELRGAGEILGTRQSGLAEFRIADPQRDAHCLPEVQALAERVMQERPEMVGPLIARWLPAAPRYLEA